MADRTKYKLAEKVAKKAFKGAFLGKDMSRSFPGYLFFKIAKLDGLATLVKKPNVGSILLTGTNGKTTTTTNF